MAPACRGDNGIDPFDDIAGCMWKDPNLLDLIFFFLKDREEGWRPPRLAVSKYFHGLFFNGPLYAGHAS